VLVEDGHKINSVCCLLGPWNVVNYPWFAVQSSLFSCT